MKTENAQQNINEAIQVETLPKLDRIFNRLASSRSIAYVKSLPAPATNTEHNRIDKDKLPLSKRIAAHVFEEAFMDATALSPEDFQILRSKLFAHAEKPRNAPLAAGLHDIFSRIMDRRDELTRNKIRKLEKDAITDL
ncbi:MAG: hypothetical protein R3D66_00850 [Alphaproteobacteria bacterium]